MMRTNSSVAKKARKEKREVITIDPLHLTQQHGRIIEEMCNEIHRLKKSTEIICQFKASTKWYNNLYEVIMPPEDLFEKPTRHVVQFTHHLKVYPHQLIEPRKLTPLTNKILALLIATYSSEHQLESADLYTGKPVHYFLPAASGKKGVITLYIASLSRTLICNPKENKPNEIRYEVCAKSPFTRGARTALYKVKDTIKTLPAAKGEIQLACKRKKRILVAKQPCLPMTSRHQVKVREDNGKIDRTEQNAEMAREAYLLRQLSFFKNSKAILSNNESCPTLLMPLVPGRDLFEVLMEHNNAENPFKFTTDQLIQLTIMAANAILKVHAKNMIHRDIKTENMVIEMDGKNNPIMIRVVDVGISHLLNEKPVNELCGTLGYIAPEVLQGGPVTQQIDVYSFAVDLEKVFWKWRNKLGELLSAEHVQWIDDIIARGKHKDPAERATIADIIYTFNMIQEDRAANKNKLLIPAAAASMSARVL